MDRRLMTVSQVADMLGISVRTVRRKLEQRELPGVKIGKSWRVSRTKLEEMLQLQEEEADVS